MTEKQLAALMTSGGGIRLAARGTSYVKYLPFSELSRPDGVALTSLPAGIYTLTVEGPVRVVSFVGGLRGRKNQYSVLISKDRTVKLSVKVVG